MRAVILQDRSHWHALRAQHIGGSEIAALFYLWKLANDQLVYLHMFEEPPSDAIMLGCASRHTTGYRLWHEKAGLLTPPDLDGYERIRLGQHLEAGIAGAAREKWKGWPLQKVHRYIRHPSLPGMGASRDYEERVAGYPPVEIKNVDYLVFRDLWSVKGDEIDAPPIDITLQVQHQIACEGSRATHGWIVACVGGSSLKRGRIERHAPTIARIEQAVAAFWAAVAAGSPPLDVADYDTVADASLLSARADATPADLTADNRLPTLCSRLLKVQGLRKRIEGAEERIKSEIAVKVASATRATTVGYRIIWPLVQRGEKSHRGGLTIKEA